MVLFVLEVGIVGSKQSSVIERNVSTHGTQPEGYGQTENDDVSEGVTANPSEVASTTKIQNHRTRVLEAQKKFFGRNAKPRFGIARQFS